MFCCGATFTGIQVIIVCFKALCFHDPIRTIHTHVKLIRIAQCNFDSLIQRWSTVVAFSNTAKVREFVQEWYSWCQKEHVIAADAFGDKPKHCHDQSIFSVLTHQRRIGDFTTTRFLGHHAFDRSVFKRSIKRLFSMW